MIAVKELYDTVSKDFVNSAENGNLTFASFNRRLVLAVNRIMDYISGDIENLKPPAPYTSQKVKDYLSEFITKYDKPVVGGEIPKPEDYYGFENMFMIGNFDKPALCDDEETEEDLEVCNTVVELVDGGEFTRRCGTYINGLRPSFRKPIAKMVGDKFEFAPKDIGNVVLEYIRYPNPGKIVGKMDEEYHVPVIDEAASENVELGEWARELLVYFITESFSTTTREDSLLQHVKASGKLVRDEK